MHFLNPFVSVLTDSQGPKHFAEFLSQRGSVDYLCRKLEDLEEEATRKEKQADDEADPEKVLSESVVVTDTAEPPPDE